MHHKWMPLLVVLFGLTFLLGDWNVFTQSQVSVIWPILVILGGLAKMKHCHCCGNGERE